MKIEITPKEELELDRAVDKAVKDVREIEATLKRIGARLKLRWQPRNPNHVLEMVKLVADNHSSKPSMHFTSKDYWR